MIVPSNRNWTTQNLESKGDFFYTRNINFDNEGYATLSKRSTALLYNPDASFSTITSILNLGGVTYYAVSGTSLTAGKVFSFDLSGTTVTEITGVTPTYNSDGVVWQNLLFVSGRSNIASSSGAAFTSRITGLSDDIPHPLCSFESLNFLAVGNGKTVQTYNTSYALQATCTIPAEFEVRWIRYKDSNIYIGTKHTGGGDAKMFIWNGSGSAPQAAYAPGGSWIFSGEIFKTSVVVLASTGQLMQFNGGGFSELANLPVYYSNKDWLGGNTYVNGKVAQRGMKTDGGILYINLDGSLSSNDTLPQQPSGLWVYDPKIGLYNKAGWSNTKLQSRFVTALNLTTSTFTCSSYSAITGTPVLYALGVAGGFTANQIYYLIRVSSTTFRLALTHERAVAGTAIVATSTGSLSPTEIIWYHDDFEFGQTSATGNRAYAIALVSNYDYNPSTYKELTGSQVLFGALVSNDGTGGTYAAVQTLQTLTGGLNKGHMVTSKIPTGNIKQSWQDIVTKYENLFMSVDKIIISYRTKNREVLYVSDGFGVRVSWLTTTQFSVPRVVLGIEVGDMVEIVGMAGSGNTSFVTKIDSRGDGTTRFTIADTQNITVADESSIYITNYKKLGVTSYLDVDRFLQTNIGKSSKWVQFHIELQGQSSPYLEELNLANTINR